MVHSTHSMDERSFQRLLRRTVALPVALLVLLAIVLVVEILSLTSSLRQVDSTLEVISNARSLLRYMVDMESSIRGYYLTGKSEYLQPFVADKSAVSRELAVLRQLTADNPVQEHRIEELDELDRRWIAFADRSPNRRKTARRSSNKASNSWTGFTSSTPRYSTLNMQSGSPASAAPPS